MRLLLLCCSMLIFSSLHSMEEDPNSQYQNNYPLLITTQNANQSTSFIERLRQLISPQSGQSTPPITIEEKRRLQVEHYITKSDFVKVRSLFAYQKSQILENNTDYQRYLQRADQILRERENEVAKRDIPWHRFVPFIVLSISSLGLTLEALTIDNATGTWPWQLRMALGLATTGGIFMHGMKTLFPTWSEYNHLQAQCIMNLIKANQPQEEPH